MKQTRHVGVQDERKNWKHCIDSGIADHQETLIERHRREVEHGRKDCLQNIILSEKFSLTKMPQNLHCGDDESPVDDELAEACRPLVAVSAMDKEKSANVTELKKENNGLERLSFFSTTYLGDREISSKAGLFPFLPDNPNAHAGSLNQGLSLPSLGFWI